MYMRMPVFEVSVAVAMRVYQVGGGKQVHVCQQGLDWAVMDQAVVFAKNQGAAA